MILRPIVHWNMIYVIYKTQKTDTFWLKILIKLTYVKNTKLKNGLGTLAHKERGGRKGIRKRDEGVGKGSGRKR